MRMPIQCYVLSAFLVTNVWFYAVVAMETIASGIQGMNRMVHRLTDGGGELNCLLNVGNPVQWVLSVLSVLSDRELGL